MKKINFYLLNEKGYSVINKFLNVYNSENIGFVVIGKDSNIKNDYSKEIEKICIKNNIKFYYRNDKIPTNNDYTFAIGWRWIIKECENLVVLHDSILPKYRGFAPLVNSLINGEKHLGVTALFASEEYDKGNIIYQKSIEIDYPIKINEAIKKVSSLYEDIVILISKKIINDNDLETIKQNDDLASYSLWRDEEDYFINWNQSSEKIKRFVDAVGYPYDGAKCIMNGEEIIINEVTIINDLKIENRQIGKVIFFNKEKPVVVCKEGLIRIDDAVYSNSQKSIFPLNKFRVRFK
jgi:methionyl-tRNA formyltransferase